jgi:DDB1- and CUL4-associated factor 13
MFRKKSKNSLTTESASQSANMKVVALTRSQSSYVGRAGDVWRVARNPSPALHPFQGQREYTRALQATKLERLLAKPFLHAFDQHHDSVSVLATHPSSLVSLYSGACDGEIKAWHLG